MTEQQKKEIYQFWNFYKRLQNDIELKKESRKIVDLFFELDSAEQKINDYEISLTIPF